MHSLIHHLFVSQDIEARTDRQGLCAVIVATVVIYFWS